MVCVPSVLDPGWGCGDWLHSIDRLIFWSPPSETWASAEVTWTAFSGRWLGPTPRVSDSAGLEWGLRICICNKSPGDAAAPGPGTALGEAELQRSIYNFPTICNSHL